MSLAIKNLTKCFGTFTAVDDLSFEAKGGTIFGLLGRNGAGKSTTIKQILGLLAPTSGSIEWNGLPIDQKAIAQNKISIGYLPEERGLFVKKSVYDQLVYFGQLECMKKAEINQSIDYWLDKMQVSENKNAIVSALSKGNQQKIQLVATLLHDPKLIILDEPFTGLDPVNVQIFVDIIKDESAKGKTIIFSSHQMVIVEELCDELVLLKEGKAEVGGTIEEIKGSYNFKNLAINASDEAISGLKKLDIAFDMDKNTIKIKTENSQKAMDILNKLAGVGVVPTEFNVASPTMQEIFVKLLA